MTSLARAAALFAVSQGLSRTIIRAHEEQQRKERREMLIDPFMVVAGARLTGDELRRSKLQMSRPNKVKVRRTKNRTQIKAARNQRLKTKK